MLIGLVLAAQLSGASSPAEPPLQVLAGPGFEALLRLTAAQCPQSEIRYVTPATLLDAEDTFEDGLNAGDRALLLHAIPRTADGEAADCEGRDGASCPATHTLIALDRAGLMPAFARAVCARGSRPWD